MSFKFTNKQRICLFGFIFLILILILSSVSAINCDFSIPPVKQYTCAELIQTCSNCTQVNITKIYYPGESIELNEEMTQFANTYNYTFCNNSILGTYIYSTQGNPDGISSTGNVCYQVTTSGNDKLNTIPMFLLIAGFLLFALAVYKSQPIIGFGSGVLLSIAGVYLLIYGLGVLKDVYTDALAYVALFIGLIISFASAYEQLED